MVARALELRKTEQQRPREAPGLAKSATSDCETVDASNNTDIMDCISNYTTDFSYGTSSILFSSYDRSAGAYNMRVRIINQSYCKGLKKKAYGVTAMSIRKSGSGDPFFGLTESSCPTYNVIEQSSTVEYRRTGDYFSVVVKVENSSWQTGRCEVRHRTSRSGGAQSRHTAKYTSIDFRYWSDGEPYVRESGPYSIINNKKLE